MLRTLISQLLMLIIVAPVLIYASTTGKISGLITDKETGEALPGANIVLEGTLLGASTDLEGYFAIINVPPGEYSLKVSYIGYVDKIVNNVRVRIDRTTPLNVTIAQSNDLIADKIVVVAKNERVRRDVSSSVVNIDVGDVESLPLIDISGIVGMQAGIENGFTIRGGGLEQTDFLVDGASLKDDRTNEPATTSLPLSSIQELAVQTGGFNAEYGMVRSGVINTVIKEGSRSKYVGSIKIDYSPATKKHFGISPFDRNSFWLRPYFDDAVAWTGTENGTWDEYTQKQYLKFVGWNEISRRTYQNNDPSDDLTPTAAQRVFAYQHRRNGHIVKPDYNIDMGFGGPVPVIGKKLGNLRFYSAYRNFKNQYLVPLSRDAYSDENLLLKISSNITPAIKLNILGLYGETYGTASNTESGVSFFTDQWSVASGVGDGLFKETRLFSNAFFSRSAKYRSLISVKLTHTLSPSTFYELSLKHSTNNYRTIPVAQRDTSRNIQIFPGYFLDEAPFGYIDASVDGITGFHMGGHIGEARDFSRTATTRARFDISSQIGRHHFIKAGLDFSSTYLKLEYGGHNSQFPGLVSWNSLRKTPFRGAFYIQDKIEFEGFVANLGLRGDYNNPNTKWVSVTPYNKDFYTDKYNKNNEGTIPKVRIKPQITFSPRLGIAHPIGENSKIYFNYGHFRQLPSAEGIYELRRTGFNQLISIGNPSLSLEKTVAYELGYEQDIDDMFLIHLAGYYKDISAQRSYVHYVDISEKVNYWKEENNNYQDIRGFEVTLRKDRGDWVTGFANYTYMVQTGGFFGVEEHFENPSDQRDYLAKNPKQEKPLPQPYARINLNFHTPTEYGPKYFGIKPLADWRMGFLFNWRSGEWDTWNPNDRPGLLYNIQWHNFTNLDLRISKLFTFNNIIFTFFADISNLLNFKEFSQFGFYNEQDRFDYLKSLHMPSEISKKISSIYIPGDDRPGDSRKTGTAFTPIKPVGSIDVIGSPKTGLIYYELISKKYMEYKNGSWNEVSQGQMKKIMKDKSYIDMPNQTSFTFLNPRDVFLGLKISFNF